MTKKKAEIKTNQAERGTVLFAALRMTNDETDAFYMGSKNGMLNNVDLTDKELAETDMYLLAPIPSATLKQQEEKPQILALHNYDQAKSVAFTMLLYMTGRFDEEQNKKMTLRQALTPVVASETEDAMNMRFDKAGVLTVHLNESHGIAFDAESRSLLAESHVKELTAEGHPHPQLIYLAVLPGCKTMEFKALPMSTKYLTVRKKEIALMKASAEAYQARLIEQEAVNKKEQKDDQAE